MKSLIIPINRAFLFLFLSIFCLVYFQSTAWAASYTINTSKGNLSSGVQLDWTSTNGPNVTYQIYRSLGLNGTKALLTSVSNANTYTDTTATPGIVYGYYVKESGDATQSSNDFGYRTQTTSTIMGTGDYVKVFATDGDPNSYASSSFALKSDGRLFASGYNAWGQLGDGTNTDSTKFKQVLTGVQDMVAGLQTSLALKTDGTLWAVGLGYGYTWTQVLSGVSSLSGFYAIKSGTAYSGSSPTNWASTGYTNIKAISSSAGYTYTLATDGTLKAWWSDYYGVHNSTIGTGIKKIQAGYESSCYYSCSYYPFVYGIKNDNSLWVYGGLNFGHGLGLRPSTGLQYVLNDVDDVQINSGSMTVLAKKTDGTLWSTSKSSNGLDGDGTSTPTSYWKQVFDNVAYASPGLAHSMVLRTNGTIWVSGLNVKGAHGLGDTTSRTVWTQTGVLGNLIASKGTVNGSVDLFWESDYGTGVNYEIWRSNGLTGTKSKIATTTLNTYSDTTASYGVTSGIVYDYHVQTIGGQKTNTDYGYRTPASNAITGSGTYSKVSAGVSHSLALKSDGRLFAAGSNGSGELGDASTTASGTFKQVLTGVQDMIAGNAVSLALKTDGTLWAVGQGYGTTWAQVLSGVSSLSGFYAIKSGTAYSGSSPTNWASTGYTGIKQLLMGTSSYGSMSGSSSGTHPVLLKTDGSVVTVSTGYYGVEYTTIGTGFKKIALTASYWVGSYSGGTSWGLVGIKNDGTLWLYGAAKSNIASGSGFIQILNNVIDVSTNNTNYQIFATHNDGSLWANTYTQPGIYGDGTTTETSYWKQVFANVSNTSAGANHTLALRSNGTIWVTGQNASKQHGLNDTTNRTTWTQTGFILPAKVTGVSATDGTQYSKVAVGWTADPDATQYDVFRSNAAGTKGTAIASNVTATSFEDTTVSGSTHYFYTVVAKNPVGSGPDSDQNEGYGKVPTVVASLSATQGTVTDKIRLVWTENPDATSYEVWRSVTAGGAATKIATLSAPASGMDDVSVSGVSSYFYTVKTVVGALTGAASNEVEGWANGALTSATAALTASSTAPSAATAVSVVDPNVTAGKTEAYTFAITTPPTTGTLALVGNKFVYTPPADGLFAGPLTFAFSATDKGGSVITGTGAINVTCGSPSIAAFTLPLTNVTQASPFAANATFSLPACSTNGQIKVDVLDSNAVVVVTGAYVATANGAGLTHQFTSKGPLAAGSYTVRMTADSDSGAATKTAVLTVKAVNLPTLSVAPGLSVTVGEETVTASLSNPSVVNCPFTSDPAVAQADASKCYVGFSTPPNGMTLDTSGALPALSGTLDNAGSFPITAEVHKFDGTALVKIGEVTKTVTASCVAPTISTLDIPALLPYEVPNYGATYKAYSCNGALSGTLSITKGSTTVETLTLSALDYGASVNLTKSGTGLAAGNYIALLNINGSSGTGSKSQPFSVKTAPMPALSVSPTTASQGETRVDAMLQPSTDPSCPLTTDINLAQTDSHRCYIELTSTVPDLTPGTDAGGLPTLAGYPATVGDYTVTAQVSRWVNGTRYDAEPLIKTVKVTPVVPPTFAFTGKSSVYAGIEKVNLIFKQDSGTVCNLYPDQGTAQTEAARGKRACFVNFAGDTGLSKTLSLNQFKMEGSLTTPGTQTLSYEVKRAFADGMVTAIQTGDLPITVNDLPPPQVTLKGGYKISDGIYYVPRGQAITRATITAGVPTNAKMKIAITDSQQSFERGGVMTGGSYWLSTPALGLLEERPVTLRVSWQDHPSVYNERVITAVGGTENNMKLVVEAPAEIADTDMITVKVKVGKYTKTGFAYTPETMGQWRTQIVAQTNTLSVKTPITEMQDMVNGEATFQINPAGNLFMKLTAVSELITTVDGLDSTLSSSTRFVEVVKGSPIEGVITAKTLDAPAPKTFTLNLEMTMDNRIALKEVAWQESTDNGDTWTTIEKSNTIRHNVAMQEPGKRQVRARMVNKNTLAESFTAPVDVWAYSTLDAQITGPRHMAPGYTATLASELYREGVLTANTVNEWKIEAPSGITTATGATATITEEQEGKIYITLKTRPADTRADDANAWSIARYYLTVKTPTRPSVSGKGPRDVETGKIYHYDGATRPSWGAVPSVHTIQSEWQLPDGATVAGDSFDWTPTAQDLADKTPLKFRAWVEGFKDTTTSEMTISYAPWEYVWPEFTMTMKQLTVQAPSDLLLMVNHNRPDMNRRFEGLTYTWSFPQNVTGRQNDAFPNRAAAQVLYAGEYDVSVTIRDTRGHETVVTQHIVAQAAVPYNVTLKVGKSNVFDRVPMTVTVRPTIYGGHPLDSVIAQAWKIDGIPIDEFANRSYMVSDITETGSHVISYTLNSKMGETTTVNSPINLISNQLPVCELKAVPNAYVVYAEAKCTDPDGKVLVYAWEVNGQPIGSTSYRISFSKTATPQSASVTITAMDDAKGYSVPVSITVSY